MKEYNIYHNFEMKINTFYFPGTPVIHYQEQREDDIRKGIKEKYLFDGFSIYFLFFELTFGVKIYEATI